MKATMCRDYRIAGINKMVLIAFAISSLVFATKGTAQDTLISKVPVKDSCLQIDNTAKESNRKGFYLSTPVYLYGTYSSSGLQVGYQFKKIQLRAEVNFVNDYQNGKEIWFAMPTVGFFFSKTLSSKIRTYEGITFGVETGIKNSFEGETGFGSCIGGIEFLVSDKTAFFLEFGTGEAFSHKEGIFNTGTILGGGFKGYLGKDCRSKENK